MRILYLSAGEFPSRAANSLQIQAMCAAFAGVGHAVTLTGFAGGGEAAVGEDGFARKLLPYPGRFRPMRRAALQARWRCRRDRPGLAYSREPILGLAAAMAGVAVAYEPHKLPPEGSRNDRAMRALFEHPRLRLVAPISQGLLDDMRARYETPRHGALVVVAHDGAFAGPEPMPAPDNPRMRIGYFGHLYRGKGMETIAALAMRLPQFEFAVFGGQPADVARWRDACAASPNLNLHGHIGHDRVRAEAERCDVLLAPYGEDVRDISGRDIVRWMSPLKIFEYMTAGRAIVASDLHVLREVLVDRETAVLVRAGDIEAWAGALVELAENAGLRRSLGLAARREVVARYTWEARARAILGAMGAAA